MRTRLAVILAVLALPLLPAGAATSHLEVSFVATPGTVRAGDSATVVVAVTDPVAGGPTAATVTFSATRGSFSPASTGTEPDGRASSVFTAPDVAARTTVTVAALATLGDRSGSRSTTITVLPVLRISIDASPDPAQAGETVTVIATITAAGSPIADATVDVSFQPGGTQTFRSDANGRVIVTRVTDRLGQDYTLTVTASARKTDHEPASTTRTVRVEQPRLAIGFDDPTRLYTDETAVWSFTVRDQRGRGVPSAALQVFLEGPRSVGTIGRSRFETGGTYLFLTTDGNGRTSIFYTPPRRLDAMPPIDLVASAQATGYLSSGEQRWPVRVLDRFDLVPPEPPSGVNVTVVGGSLRVAWDRGTDNFEVSHYVLLRDFTEIANTTTLTFVDASVEAGEPYVYQVVSVDHVGNTGPPSDATTGKVPDHTAPELSDVRLPTVSSTHAVVSFASNENVTADVLVQATGGEPRSLHVPGRGKRFEEVVRGLAPETSYTFTVVARDRSGNERNVQLPAIITLRNVRPSLAILGPAAGTVLRGPATLTGSAGDADGFLERIEIRGGSLEWATLPATASWSAALDPARYADGPLVVTARAFDGADYSPEATLPITVAAPPHIGLVTFAPARITEDDDVLVSVTVRDNSGTAAVDLVVVDAPAAYGGPREVPMSRTRIDAEGSETYAARLTGLSAGVATLRVDAEDLAGNEAASPEVPLRVHPPSLSALREEGEAFANRTVTVEGVVVAAYEGFVAVQDADRRAAVLVATEERLAAGDLIRVQGVLAADEQETVVRASEVSLLGETAPPPPLDISTRSVAKLYEERGNVLVSVSGEVTDRSDRWIELTDGSAPTRLYFKGGLERPYVRPGDRIDVTGVLFKDDVGVLPASAEAIAIERTGMSKALNLVYTDGRVQAAVAAVAFVAAVAVYAQTAWPDHRERIVLWLAERRLPRLTDAARRDLESALADAAQGRAGRAEKLRRRAERRLTEAIRLAELLDDRLLVAGLGYVRATHPVTRPGAARTPFAASWESGRS